METRTKEGTGSTALRTRRAIAPQDAPPVVPRRPRALVLLDASRARATRAIEDGDGVAFARWRCEPREAEMFSYGRVGDIIDIGFRRQALGIHSATLTEREALERLWLHGLLTVQDLVCRARPGSTPPALSMDGLWDTVMLAPGEQKAVCLRESLNAAPIHVAAQEVSAEVGATPAPRLIASLRRHTEDDLVAALWLDGCLTTVQAWTQARALDAGVDDEA